MKYYFYCYCVEEWVHGNLQIVFHNGVLKDTHPIIMQKTSPSKTLISWQEISWEEYDIYAS